jgi:hypothetical protein
MTPGVTTGQQTQELTTGSASVMTGRELTSGIQLSEAQMETSKNST